MGLNRQARAAHLQELIAAAGAQLAGVDAHQLAQVHFQRVSDSGEGRLYAAVCAADGLGNNAIDNAQALKVLGGNLQGFGAGVVTGVVAGVL